MSAAQIKRTIRYAEQHIEVVVVVSSARAHSVSDNIGDRLVCSVGMMN
jgi:hypothetical protein